VRIEILTQAKEDLFEGWLFYERQQPGIGDYFLDSLSADIESLLLHHGYHRQFHGFHRMIARVFPFSIYYRVSGDVIHVDAVVDQRRNPESIKRLLLRLKQGE
jgi:plasmid stabilization system protein ParE